MSVWKKAALLVVFFCILLLSGCASFKGHRVPEVKKFPPESGVSDPIDRPSVCIATTWSWESRIDPEHVAGGQDTLNGQADFWNTYRAKTLTREAVQLADHSDLFASISPCECSVPAGYYRIDLAMLQHAADDGIYSFGMRFLFIFVIPCVMPCGKDMFQLTATVSDSGGNELRVYQYEDSVGTWAGLIFLPLSPLVYPNKIERAVRQNMLKQFYCDLAEDGLLHHKRQ